MVLKSEIYVNDKVYPKRLLDVTATVESKSGFCFVLPTDWDFHIISHTWTDSIRALVKDCKAILTASGWTKAADPQGLIYAQTITKSQFSDKSYYPDVVNFLSILQSDGVKKVWLDAVCINQYDSDEMASEMHLMGAYYSLSNACYVAPHGIGSSNGFKVLGSDLTLPRWFSRVWTLQEYMLPEKLYFLVEKFEAKIIEFIEKEGSSHPEDKAWIDWDSGLDDVSSSSPGFVEGAGDYSRRKAGGSSSDLYFVGAKAYFEMMGTLLGVYVYGLSELSPKMFGDFYEAFGELAAGVEEIIMETLVKQIRVRYATDEDDRVLGILGVIGFKGDYELAKNATLDEELVGLAKLLFKQKHVTHLLINMCAAEYEGYEVAGISWAPDLRADPDTSRAEFRRYYAESYAMVKDYSAVVTDVQEDGSLVLQAQIAKGTLIKTADQSGISYLLKVGLMAINLRHDTDLDDNLPIHTYYADSDHRGWQGGMMIAAPGIQKLKGYSSQTAFTVSDISLVFLGHDRNPGKHGATCVLMACIPIGDQKLHKIGTIHPHPSLTARARKLFVSGPTQVVIGGVGGDLTPYLDKECQAVLKNLQAN